jgi:hypothetical protein
MKKFISYGLGPVLALNGQRRRDRQILREPRKWKVRPRGSE